MTTVGRKPSGNDAGWGLLTAGWGRGNLTGSTTVNGWITQFGARCGRYDSGTPTVQIAAYTPNGGDNLGDIVALSATFSAPALMLDAYSGSNYTATPLNNVPVIYKANRSLSLAVRCQGARLTLGQDSSGLELHQRNVGTSFPDPFAATTKSPEGKLSVWVEITPNTAPSAPSNVSPADGASVTDQTPDLAMDFRDAEETVGGASLGNGDRMSAWQFEVWNSAGTTRLQTSGKQTATATQQTNRRATWTVPTALTAGATYQIRGTVWDRLDTASAVTTWRITIPGSSGGGGSGTTGGNMSLVTLVASALIGTNATDQPMPDFQGRWNGTASTASVQARVLNSSGSVARAVFSKTVTVANAATVVIDYAETGWAALAIGSKYRIQLKAIDTAGIDSPWVSTGLFTVNSPPGVPYERKPPVGAAYETYPTLEAKFSDSDHPSSSLTVDFMVRPAGNTGTGVRCTSLSYIGGDLWRAANTATTMPAKGQYEWRARATDPAGGVGGWSTWIAVGYLNPQTVTITSPAEGSVSATGTPTVTWTFSTTQSAFRVLAQEQIFTDQPEVYFDSGVITSSAQTYTVPAGALHNNMDVSLIVIATAPSGISAQNGVGVSISYPVVAALTGVTAVPVGSLFEPVSQASSIQVSWNPVSEAVIASVDFAGYLVHRIDLETGESLVLRHLLTRDETVFVDRTPRSGTPYRYEPTALKVVNLVDWVETQPAPAFASVKLAGSVLSDLAGAGVTLPLPYWTQRGDSPVRDIEVIPTLGRRPVTFQGLLNYSVIAGSFQLFDLPELFVTVFDLLDAARTMIQPDYDELGRPRPRELCYRDGKRRCLLVAVTGYSEDDDWEQGVARISVELTENTRLAPRVVSAPSAEAS